jgi:hypothetical protein
MAVRLSVLRAGRPLPLGRFLVLISVRGWVDPRFIVRLAGQCELSQNKSGSENFNVIQEILVCAFHIDVDRNR